MYANKNFNNASGTALGLDEIGVNAEDIKLRKDLLYICENENNNLSCLGSQLTEIKNFINNPQNIVGIREAVAKLGMPTPNRAAERKGFRWVDYCDYASIAEFYTYAQLAVKYPKFPVNQQACSQLKSLLLALNQERLNKRAYYSNMDFESYFDKSLQAKLSEYESLYARLTCDEYIVQQQESAASAARTAELKAAAMAQASAFGEATKKGVSNVGIYVLGGVAGLIALIITVRVLRKPS